LSALRTKLWRDTWRLRGPLAAIVLVMACGVAAMVMSISASRSLQRSLGLYYDQGRFAELFATLKRAPMHVAERVADLPFVAVAESRIVLDVTLDVPGVREPVIGRIISLPTNRAPALNRVYLRAGREPLPGRAGEVLVNEAFAEALGLAPGDEISAVINGGLERLRVTGMVLSPEFVYAIRPGAFVPDDRRFAVLWMNEDRLAEMVDMDGAFNDLLVRLAPGTRVREARDAIDALTEPWGGRGAHGRDQQTSHVYVSDELQQLGTMAVTTPSIFLTVSALLLNIVLGRLVRTQREQIGVLKAFGYSAWSIGRHYAMLASIVVVTGSMLGVGGGIALADVLLDLYRDFFRFPVEAGRFEPAAALIAVAASAMAAGLGAAVVVRRAARLPPAVAMRPEAPADYRSTIVERLGVLRWLSAPTRMIIRHIERQPVRAAVNVLGLTLAVAVLSLGSYIEDAVEFLMEFQFEKTQRYDLAVTFREPRSSGAIDELRALPGVLCAEAMRTVPVRLVHGGREKRDVLTGLEAEPRLSRALDEEGRPVRIPPSGLVLSQSLAERLDAAPGAIVTVEVLEGQRPVLDMPVERIVATYVGTAAYLDIDALRRVMHEGSVVSGAYLTADPLLGSALFDRLKHTPIVSTVTVKRATIESFANTMAENLLLMRMFNVAFATVIAVGVVYNSARIALAERAHELATLRVLGLYRSEVAAIFFGELALLTLSAVPAGVAAGYGMCAFMTRMMTTETHRIPLVVDASTLAFSVVVVLIAAIVTAWRTRRLIDRLDLLAVLKAAG